MIRCLVKITASVLVFLVCFELGFELVLRLIGLGILPVSADSMFRSFHMNIERQILSYMPTCAQYDAELTYVLKPGSCQFANREYDTTLHVNSQGLRDDELSLEAPEIIVLGDSHAMGWGVQQHEAFPQLLEKTLGMKVLNAGEPSYGTARELLLLKRLDTRRLRYLVLQYCNNDDDENSQYLNRGGKQVAMSPKDFEWEGEEYRAQMPYYLLKYLDFSFGEVQFLLGQWWERRNGRLVDHLPADEARAAADRFLLVLEKSGIELPGVRIIVININGVEKQAWPFMPELRPRLQAKAASQAGGLLPALVAIDIPELASQQYYFRLDDHMNAKGHQRVAEQLVNVIREDSVNATEQH